MQRPNIIYMHSHDTGRYISPYGHATRTPHLQNFAEHAVLFRQAFTVNPTCSPSRAALLTGRYPHNNGMLGLTHRGFSLNNPEHHLVHTLNHAGYHTVLAGFQHLAHTEAQHQRIGYAHHLQPPSKHAPDVAPAAARFIENAPHDQPFFLDVGFFETHRKFPDPDPADDPRYTRPPDPLPDTPETRRDMAGYNTMAHQLDEGIGQVLAALDDAGLADNTLVIITTDHGIAFPDMKGNLTDHGIGVMLMIRGPKDSPFRGGQVCDAMVTHLDLFPTLCDIAGIDKPDWLQGQSLLPLVRGEQDHLHDAIFAETNFHAAYEPRRGMRTHRYKYIRRFDARTRPVLPNCDDGESKRLWLAHGWADTPLDQEYLFDLVFDPTESSNIAHRPDMTSVLEDMRSRLHQWMQQTDDPLLQGPLTIPAGATLNAPDDPEPDNDTAELIQTPRPAP